MIKKGDILIIVSLCVVCALLFVSSIVSSGGSKIAVIYLDGKIQQEIELASVEKEYLLEVGGCVLKVDKNSIEFCQSTCPDKLCVKKGRLSDSGDTMACVPNKVAVSVKSTGKNQFDAVAY